MWSDNTVLCERTGREYWRRIDSFRRFEAEQADSSAVVVPEAWALLPDLETTFAARAYFACLCVACAMVEIQIRKATKEERKPLSQLVRELELDGRLGWLLHFRNDALHGNQNEIIKYCLDGGDQNKLDDMCREAFIAVHRLPAALERAGYKP